MGLASRDRSTVRIMKLFKVSVRGKILGTIILVSTLVVLCGAYLLSDALRESKGIGRYLEAHAERYQAMEQDIGQGEFTVARVLGSDPALASALESDAQAELQAVAKRLVDDLSGSLAPDLLLISNATGHTYPGPGLTHLEDSDWRGSRLYQDLRSGTLVRAKPAVLGRKAYRVSGSPVQKDGRIVGVVLVGQKLDTWFRHVARRSQNKEPEKQHRISLVEDDDHVLASALPRSMYAQLLQAIQKPKQVQDGSEGTIPVLDMGKFGDYDFWKWPAIGYRGPGDPESNKLGTYYLIRSRYHRTSKLQEDLYTLLTVFAAGLLIAVIMGYLLAIQITRPLRRYIQATQDLTRGKADLSKRLEVETRDELGVLAHNLNRVFAKIHSLAAGVQRSAFQVNASSGEISAVSKQMLSDVKKQATKVGNSTAAVTELSSSIQQVAENAAEATRTAKQSGEAVTRAIERLQSIRTTVEDAARRIGALGESGKRIGNIVEVIRQISEQTTMLALNAAIEAAHAGEHGRGFAVVADEVSSLAKRTGQSARDIEDLIATIRSQTSEAVHVMQDGTRVVEEGTGLVEATLADLKTLISVIDDTAAAVQEQAIASDEIARNMDAVQSIADNVVLSTETAVQQSDSLQGLAEDLEQSVKGFRIDPEQLALDEAELKALPEPESRNTDEN